jgi:hypothetical protein
MITGDNPEKSTFFGKFRLAKAAKEWFLGLPLFERNAA